MSEPKLTEIFVEGMTCSNCAAGVQRRLEKQGLQKVNVNFASGEVVFENNDNKPMAAIIDSIEDLGYKVIKADSPQKKNF